MREASDTHAVVLNRLQADYGPETVLTDRADCERYDRDSSREFRGIPSAVLRPASVEQVSTMVRSCAEHRIAIVPSGGRTGYSGGATATKGEVILSLERMSKVLSVSTDEKTARVQAGVTLQRLQEAALAKELWYPVDLAARGSAQIGGTIATNAGGVRVVRYGSTREWVKELTVVLATGEVITVGGRLTKDNTGYDLRSLLIGSEGTLGIIVEALMGLTEMPGPSALAMLGIGSHDEILPIFRSVSSTFPVTLFEFFDRQGLELVVRHRGGRDPFVAAYGGYLLIEVSAPDRGSVEQFEELLSSLISSKRAHDVVIAASIDQRDALMKLRELIGDVANAHFVPHKNDVSVSVQEVGIFLSRLETLVRQEMPQDAVTIFGHVGDGNVHVNILKPLDEPEGSFFARCGRFDEKLFALIRSMRGSVSAEHGVGLLKKSYLELSRSALEIELMKRVKLAFDPKGVLNPGKIFEPLCNNDSAIP